MWNLALPFLKSPYTWLIVAIVALIAYHKVVVWDFEKTVGEQKLEIGTLTQNLTTCKGNFSKAVEVNKDNEKTLDECVKNNQTLSKSYEEILSGKDDLVMKLRITIADMKKPQIYPTEVVYKECVVKVKGVSDVEENSSLNQLNRIGF